MGLIPSTNRGELGKTLVPPKTNFLASPLDPIISLQDYVVELKYTIDKILTASWEKIQRDEHVILEHTVFGIIAPDSSILFQNSPNSLAAGAEPHNPLGELKAFHKPPSCYGLGQRFGSNSCRGQLCVPLLVTGAPCCLRPANVVSRCAQTSYALGTLRAHGLHGQALWDFTKATLVSKLTYASPAWFGLLDGGVGADIMGS